MLREGTATPHALGMIPIFEYPAVPYCGSDFHCKTDNDGSYYTRWVDGSLHDLDTSKEYVQQRIADFLTELISLGITGFSIYNGRFISNTDYAEIFRKLRNNLGNG
jgi:alpha-amylase